MIYSASPIKRATKAEVEVRAKFLIEYALVHQPVTVRQLYYAATVHGLTGIDKTENGYRKVQSQVLKLRQQGHMPYDAIADNSRWMRKPQSYANLGEIYSEITQSYRKALWVDSDYRVEVWVEKDALAGAILPVTAEYDVPLMVTKGFCSETFAWEAAQEHAKSDKHCLILYLGDFDRSGLAAMTSLKCKLEAFAKQSEARLDFFPIAVTLEQIDMWNLPTREPKRKSPADKAWPYKFACELDAIPPDTLRELIRYYIDLIYPREELERMKKIEAMEREQFRMAFVRKGTSE